jgi:uncharacterized membrane protein YidH (DUF202 family)
MKVSLFVFTVKIEYIEHMNFTYFAHAGHEHIAEAASYKPGGSIMLVVGAALVIFAAIAIGLMIYDSSKKTDASVKHSKSDESSE